MAIKPILHRIIVKPDSIEDVDDHFKRAKSAGLIIQKEEKDREQAAIDTGVIVAFGETVFRDFHVSENPITIGDRVVYAKYAGKTIMDNDTRYVALNDEDVIAIITTEGA